MKNSLWQTGLIIFFLLLAISMGAEAYKRKSDADKAIILETQN